MRNWNFPTFSLYPAPFFSFEPTYEELKPARAFYITPVFECFEPTYEELKHGWLIKFRGEKDKVLSLPMRNWNVSTEEKTILSGTGFEPTYEELKHYIVSYIGSPCSLFWAYLWGIETLIIRLKLQTKVQVLSLPIRNWNYPPIPQFAPGREVLSLPMRNWNLPSGGTYLWRQPSFEPTYEELKHAMRKMSGEQEHVLSLPMRNWNRQEELSVNLTSLVLSLPMRNWNPPYTQTLYI